MTLQELLKNQGLTDDQIEKIMNAMKANKIFTASEENLDVRYSKLKTDHEALVTKNGASEKLIEELKKGSTDNQELQTKITEYEAKVQTMSAELEQTKIDSAIKVALISAKAKDVDYLTYKLKEKNEKFSLDDKGNVKHLDSMLTELKTQFPTQFETADSGKKKDGKVIENTLPEGNKNKTVTKEEFSKMGYADRLALKKENSELYSQLVKK